MEQNVSREELSSRIFELFNTGEEAIEFLNQAGLQDNIYLLEDLKVLCTTLAAGIEQSGAWITLKNRLEELGLNAPLAIERICQALKEGKLENADMQYRCIFVPLFLFWKRYAEFFLIYAADEDALRRWHEEERIHQKEVREQPKEDSQQDFRYDLSIVVLFYGHKEMTEKCLEAIRKYTTSRSYELITVDNGSDEETTAWCESLPHEKKIYYSHNMGSSAAGNLIFTMAPLYMEGKYLLFVSNDVIVTPGYDEILYQCMESDPAIAAAVPVCNSASNYQTISVPYQDNNLEDMLHFAQEYNQFNPRKWTDRARLFCILGCYRPAALMQTYLAYDPLFCYDMFADDDQCCQFRRMGYRQVLCRDVFVHHYGSATIGAEQFKVMDLGRAQFYQKYNVDAWNSLGADLFEVLGCLDINPIESVRILALNPLFGESVLALCNRLKECGSDSVVVDALTEDHRYLDDMEGLFHRSGLLEDAERVLEGNYNAVIVGSGLERCLDLRAVCALGAKWLTPGGLMITKHTNYFNLAALHSTLQSGDFVNDVFSKDPCENPVLNLISDGALKAFLQNKGLELQRSISLVNHSVDPFAQLVAAALQVNSDEKAEEFLKTAGKLNLWRKRM